MTKVNPSPRASHGLPQKVCTNRVHRDRVYARAAGLFPLRLHKILAARSGASSHHLEERNSRLLLLLRLLFVLGGHPLPAFVRPEQVVSRRISVTRVRPATNQIGRASCRERV